MRINKFFAASLAAAVAAAITLAGCGGESDNASKQTVRVSHAQIESHPDHQGMLAFEKYVEDRLGDKYDVQIFPNATLGANERVMELIRQGSVEFLVVSTANVESFDKLYSLFSFPYLFTSEPAYEKFISDPKVMADFSVNSKENGFIPMAAFTAGTRNFYAKTPIRSVADLEGKKFRVQAGPTNVAMMNAFGAAATPMSFGEVYSALQQGVIDGAENNELALTDQKHGEVTKYFSYDMHQMCPDLLVGSEKFLSGLSEADLKVFQEAANEARRVEFEAWHKGVATAKEQALKMGVEFITVDVEEFRSKVLPLHEQLLNETPELRPLYDAANAANKG